MNLLNARSVVTETFRDDVRFLGDLFMFQILVGNVSDSLAKECYNVTGTRQPLTSVLLCKLIERPILRIYCAVYLLLLLL